MKNKVLAGLVVSGLLASTVSASEPRRDAASRQQLRTTQQAVDPEVRRDSTASRIDRSAPRRTPPRITADEERLTPLFDLASELSRDRSWLTSHVVSKLHERGLWLNEVFTSAPALLKVDG